MKHLHKTYTAKRLAALLMALVMLTALVGAPGFTPEAGAAQTYSYTVDVFNYNPASNPPPSLRDISQGGNGTPIAAQGQAFQPSGFYRLTFTSEHDTLSLRLSGASTDNAGAFGDGRFKLTKDYAHVYLVGNHENRGSGNVVMDRLPPVTYYMSRTGEGRLRLTAVKPNDRHLMFIYYDNQHHRNETIDFEQTNNSREPLSARSDLLPHGSNSSGQFVISADSRDVLRVGTNVWFKARTRIWHDASQSTTLFGLGPGDIYAAGDKHARFVMPEQVFTPPELAVTALNMQIGADESRRNFTWQSSAEGPGTLTIWETGKEAATSRVFDATLCANTSPRRGFSPNKTTVTGLEPGVSYSYRVSNGDPAGGAGEFVESHIYTFTTTANTGAFSLLVAADPQIRGMVDGTDFLAGDIAAWQSTLTNATAAFPNASFIATLGDHIYDAGSVRQWDGFFTPNQLRSRPLAPTAGNHCIENYGGDGLSAGSPQHPAYLAHFNPPNLSSTLPPHNGGGHYWYPYGDALFIHLNVAVVQQHHNLNHPRDWPATRQFMQSSIGEFKKLRGYEPAWTIVMMHHTPYAIFRPGSAEETELRAQLVNAMAFDNAISDLDIDLVLSGHEHVFARTLMMRKNDVIVPAVSAGYITPPGGNNSGYTKARGSKETLYMTVSAAGNAFRTNNFPNPFPPVRDWLAREYNPQYPTIAKVDVTADALTITNYRSDSAITNPAANFIDRFTLRRPPCEDCGKSPCECPCGECGKHPCECPCEKCDEYPCECCTICDGDCCTVCEEHPCGCPCGCDDHICAECGRTCDAHNCTTAPCDRPCTLHVCNDPACLRTCDAHNCTTAPCDRLCTLHVCNDPACLRTCDAHNCTTAPCNRPCTAHVCTECGRTCGNATCTVCNPLVTFRPTDYDSVSFSVAGGNGGTLGATVNGAAITNGTQVPRGSSIVFTAAPSPGFRVRGWTPANGTNTTLTINNITAGTTVTVSFEQITHRVTFDPGAGSLSTADRTRDRGHGQTVGTLPRPTRRGHAFAGWRTAANGGGQAVATGRQITEAVTFHAHWRRVTAPGRARRPAAQNRARGRIRITYRSVARVDGYIVQISTGSRFKSKRTRSVTHSRRRSWTVSSIRNNRLRAGQTYHIRVRAFRVDSTGRRVLGRISLVRTIVRR